MAARLLSFFTATILGLPVFAQPASSLLWWNPAETPDIRPSGQGWPADSANFYSRLPLNAEHTLRKDVFDLSRESAGVTLHFTTDAPAITIEYIVKEQLQFPHMPATGVSGIDLYDSLGQRITGTYKFGDTIRYRFNSLQPSAYSLYLPLYNTIKWLRIGVEKVYSLTPTHSQKPPIAIYGTSITQGACASRPAMAWTNILARHSGYDIINLGFSGNGRLEPEVIGYLNQTNAAIYILDCLPNLTDRTPDDIKDKIIHSVEQIKNAHPSTPIILTEHAGFGNEQTNAANRELCTKMNTALKDALNILRQRKTKDLYILSKKAIGFDSDCFVDQVHPNDTGMLRYAQAYLNLIDKISARKSDVKKVHTFR